MISNRHSKLANSLRWLTLIFVGLLLVIWFGQTPITVPIVEPSVSQPAWVYPDTSTTAAMQAAYQNRVLRLLVIPGHDNQFSGAVFNGVREADLNLELAKYLEHFLLEDGHFQVGSSRDVATGEY